MYRGPCERAPEQLTEGVQHRFEGRQRWLGLRALHHALTVHHRRDWGGVLAACGEPCPAAVRAELRLDGVTWQCRQVAERGEAEQPQPLPRRLVQRQQRSRQRRQPLARLGVTHAQPCPWRCDRGSRARREAAAGQPEPHAERLRRGVEQRLRDRIFVRVEALKAAQVGVHLAGRRLLDERAHGGRRFDELVGGATRARRARLEHDERWAPADGLGEHLAHAHTSPDGRLAGLGHAQARLVGHGDRPATQPRPRRELRGERERRHEQAREERTLSCHGYHPRQEVAAMVTELTFVY